MSLKKKPLYDHKWLDLTIQSGSSYPGHGFLERLFGGTVRQPYRDYAIYKPARSSIKGLELFIASGINPHTGQPWRYEYSEGDIYIHRNYQGKVTTYISCTFRSGLQSYSTCNQDWSMEQYGLGIVLSTLYAPNLLPQWQDIQTRVSHFVLEFKDPQAAPVLPATR